MTAFATSLAAIAVASAAADRLITANQSNATALVQAQTDLANADATLAGALQPLADKLTAAAPAPVVDDTADASASADSVVAGDADASADPGTAAAAAPAA